MGNFGTNSAAQGVPLRMRVGGGGVIGEGCGRSAWGHVSSASGAILDPFECIQAAKKILEMGNLHLTVQQRGVQRKCGGKGDRGGVQEE